MSSREKIIDVDQRNEDPDTVDPSRRSEYNATNDDITNFLSKIQNKYSGNAEQKHLNQLYDIGIMVANKNYNRDKLIKKLTKIVEDRSDDPIKKVREYKRVMLLEAFEKGIGDGLSDEYRLAYDKTNRYQYDSEKLKKRAHIDSVLNKL